MYPPIDYIHGSKAVDVRLLEVSATIGGTKIIRKLTNCQRLGI